MNDPYPPFTSRDISDNSTSHKLISTDITNIHITSLDNALEMLNEYTSQDQHQSSTYNILLLRYNRIKEILQYISDTISPLIMQQEIRALPLFTAFRPFIWIKQELSRILKDNMRTLSNAMYEMSDAEQKLEQHMKQFHYISSATLKEMRNGVTQSDIQKNISTEINALLLQDDFYQIIQNWKDIPIPSLYPEINSKSSWKFKHALRSSAIASGMLSATTLQKNLKSILPLEKSLIYFVSSIQDLQKILQPVVQKNNSSKLHVSGNYNNAISSTNCIPSLYNKKEYEKTIPQSTSNNSTKKLNESKIVNQDNQPINTQQNSLQDTSKQAKIRDVDNLSFNTLQSALEHAYTDESNDATSSLATTNAYTKHITSPQEVIDLRFTTLQREPFLNIGINSSQTQPQMAPISTQHSSSQSTNPPFLIMDEWKKSLILSDIFEKHNLALLQKKHSLANPNDLLSNPLVSQITSEQVLHITTSILEEKYDYNSLLSEFTTNTFHEHAPRSNIARKMINVIRDQNTPLMTQTLIKAFEIFNQKKKDHQALINVLDIICKIKDFPKNPPSTIKYWECSQQFIQTLNKLQSECPQSTQSECTENFSYNIQLSVPMTINKPSLLNVLKTANIAYIPKIQYFLAPTYHSKDFTNVNKFNNEIKVFNDKYPHSIIYTAYHLTITMLCHKYSILECKTNFTIQGFNNNITLLTCKNILLLLGVNNSNCLVVCHYALFKQLSEMISTITSSMIYMKVELFYFTKIIQYINDHQLVSTDQYPKSITEYFKNIETSLSKHSCSMDILDKKLDNIIENISYLRELLEQSIAHERNIDKNSFEQMRSYRFKQRSLHKLSQVHTHKDTTAATTPIDTTAAATSIDTTAATTPIDTTAAATSIDTTAATTPIDTTAAATSINTTVAATPIDTTAAATSIDTTAATTPIDTTAATTLEATPIDTTAAATSIDTTAATTYKSAKHQRENRANALEDDTLISLST